MEVTEEEVCLGLRKLKSGKAAGADGLSKELLKMASMSLAPSLASLFNKILQRVTYPDLWKQANVSPVHKKGSRQNKINYLPISLLPTIGKVLERLVFNRMYSFLTDNICSPGEIRTKEECQYNKSKHSEQDL